MRARVLTADTQIATNKIKVWGIILYPASGQSATVVLYDETDSSKTATKIVAALRSPYAATETESKEVMFTKPLLCSAGLYVDLEGTSATVIVYIE